MWLGRVVYGTQNTEGSEGVLSEGRQFFYLNSTNRNTWTVDGCSNTAPFGDADNGVGVTFTLGGIDGADADVVGTCGLGGLGLLVVMGTETYPFMGCIPAFSSFFDGAILLTEVNSVGIHFHGGFKVVVDDEGGLSSTGYIAKTLGLV